MRYIYPNPCLWLVLVLAKLKFTIERELNLDAISREQMTKFFQIETYEQVPDYDVIHVRSIGKRETDRNDVKQVHLTAFGETLRLNLKKNHEFQEKLKSMKFLEAKSLNGELHYQEIDEEEPEESNIGVPYYDPVTMSAVLIREQDGMLNLEGTIGHDMVIKPLLLDDSKKPETNLTMSISDVENSTHVVWKRKDFEVDDQSDYALLETPAMNNDETIRQRAKRSAPRSVWPEVLLIVDHRAARLHGFNNRLIKRYFISFWNGVDLRYKLLSRPKVRMSLAGVIVAKDEAATPYLANNILPPPNTDAVDAGEALKDLGKYLYREYRLPSYDVAVVVTKLDMCRRRTEGGRCNRGTTGFAYVGGACVVNKRLEKINSVAIIEDSGGFSGIIVAAHEVGHLLGCVHDGSPPPSYLKGPGATRCPWEDGFIMSDLRHTERGFLWSPCSKLQFKHFLNGETASCVYNFPKEKELLPRVLPGTLLSLDEQCKLDKGTVACFKDARVCSQLFCVDKHSGYCVSFRPAAEGSPCGDGQVCQSGHCVLESDNIIPDFSHQSRLSHPLPRGFTNATALLNSRHEQTDEITEENLYREGHPRLKRTTSLGKSVTRFSELS
ncbi:A disintegrin and metalloproteinase with thrombospondin motifs like [Tachypleus tridentatus]|uniref:A disintegrin and metalloproteinase with thrombospondin motifs like n=1 Tax=Tachypleus tridentatus TaxID=6853 RepID=UPI003FD40C59